ncbi:MAG: ribose ABC transporter permease [Spirochaetales bacterium]|nr:ribose ABC transporter permease [Spirochaetales bacterium]
MTADRTKRIIQQLRPFLGLVFLSLVASILSPRFLTGPNILNVLRQTSINAVIAAGMTFVILTGGIDLSVGSVMAFSGAMGAAAAVGGRGALPVLLISLAVGVISGAAMGVVITKGRVQPFIATLAGMTLLRGATLVFTDGRPITINFAEAAPSFLWLGNGRLLGVPVPIYIMAAVFGLGYYVLRHTPFGRYVYAIGGNEEAARLSGLLVERVKIGVYAVSGALAALAGVIITSRLTSAQPTAGSGYELDAIAAVVLGGTSLAGGVGSIGGTILGALVIGVLNNSLNLLNVSSYYQMIAKGAVILIAVLLDRRNR